MIKPGVYRHFKGGRCQVLGLARHSETLEEMVVYRHLYHHDGDAAHHWWVRPAGMFSEQIRRDGYEGPRFEFVSSEGPFTCGDCGADLEA
jgi:hypothetical protein